MGAYGHIVSAFLLSAALVFSANAFPQPQQPGEQKRREELSEKERKRREREMLKELDSAYRQWLEEDVAYIITDEERSAFLRLTTNEEREQFIEQFWLNRDPTPETVENEAREEHYRRIAYANERFASGIPGWKTDRGRIYIIWGPPDEIEAMPAGGSYNRPAEEGGGYTSVHAFEKWRYRYLEGIGNDVVLEFVDPTGSGEYRLTMDPSEKDALLYVPNAGLSELEALGMASKVDRFTRTDGTRLPKTLFEPARMNQFERLELFAKVQRPPARFRDLEAVVTSRILRNQIHFDFRFDYLRITSDTVLVPITIQIPNREMTFTSTQGVHSATMNLHARISALNGRIVQTFEDVIRRDIPDSLFADAVEGVSIYQKAVPLRPGLYKLDVVIKDVHSGDIGALNQGLRVPRYGEEELATSTLILADLIERVPSREVGLGQFVLGASKVRPKLDHTFSADQRMGIYFQVYNLKVDPTTHRSAAVVEYVIRRGDEEVWQFRETSEELDQRGSQITIEKLLPLAQFEPGKYRLEIQVTDTLGQHSVTSQAEFTVKAPTTTARAGNE